ncbi:MAG TPA: TolC family protein [Desulfuromonadales bacterium]|nr:TolC family protein [Desulfuromonadales bacterium]
MKFLHTSLLFICLAMVPHAWGAPLSLEDCLQKAAENNPALKSASWDSRIAEENSRIASGAKFPRVDAGTGYTVQLQPQAVKLRGTETETQEPRYAFAGITASYTVYDFGRRDARVRKEQAYMEAASEGFMFSKSDCALQVIEAYFRVLETGKLSQAAAEEVAQITEHRRVAQVLFEEGTVTRNDVLQADVRLASARQKLLAMRNNHENSWLLLNFLTGSASDFRGELDETTTVNSTGLTGVNDSDSAGNRHDILSQKLVLEARDYEVQENREHYLPELYTRLGMDYVQNDRVREQAIFSATLGIRVTLFDGFTAAAAREKAIKLRSRQQDALRLAQQRALLEIATARNDAAIARERINVSESAIRQSDENLRINRERYQERVGTATEVLDAQTLSTQAKTEHYRALYDYQVAAARMLSARGEL